MALVIATQQYRDQREAGSGGDVAAGLSRAP
jgi:hypothetical protein